MFKPRLLILMIIYLNEIVNCIYCPTGFTGDQCEIECGLTYSTPNQKIVGGSVAVANSWPSAVFLSFQYEGNFFLEDLKKFVFVNRSQIFICGGTLIDRYTVLTAAHCIRTTISFKYNRTDYTFPIKANQFYQTREQMYNIFIGSHNKSSVSDGQTIQMSVSKIIVHENYDEFTYLNDIALIKLAQPVTLSRHVQVACLPSSQSESYPSPNRPGTAVGWGTIYSGSAITSSLLRNVKLTIYDSSKCKSVSTDIQKNWRTQICCGELNGGKDTCQGDSGGPLYVNEWVSGKFKYVVAGITSYGDFCALPGLPGIYTRTSAYLSWIERNR